MAIPANAARIYRIVAAILRRGGAIPTVDVTAVKNAMVADTTSQFEFIYASSNVLIYNWAPRLDLNPAANLEMLSAVTWNGLPYTVVSASMINKL